MITEINRRVVTPRGDVGIIEEAEDGMVRVRLLTPDNEPSCYSSWCYPRELCDGTNVMPQPRSREWKLQSLLFCNAVNGIMLEASRT